MRIGRRTITALARALSAVNHSEIDALFLEYGVESQDISGSRHKRSLRLLQSIEGSAASPTDAEGAILSIAERTINQRFDFSSPPLETDELVSNLKLDGFDLVGNRFAAILPGPASPLSEASAFEEQLQSLGYQVALTHYRQAIDSFTRMEWESANAQLRAFMEALFIGVGSGLTQNRRSDPSAALQDLRNRSALDDAEYNQFRAFWAGIQDNGPHAGLSDEDECVFRLHCGTSIARYLIAKIK